MANRWQCCLLYAGVEDFVCLSLSESAVEQGKTEGVQIKLGDESSLQRMSFGPLPQLAVQIRGQAIGEMVKVDSITDTAATTTTTTKRGTVAIIDEEKMRNILKYLQMEVQHGWRRTIMSRRTIMARTEPTTMLKVNLTRAATMAASTTSSRVSKKQNKGTGVKQRAEGRDGIRPPGQGNFPEVRKRAEETIGVLKFVPEGQSFLKFFAWRMEGGEGVQSPCGAPGQSMKNPSSLEKFASKIKIKPNLYEGGTNGGRRVLKLDDCCARAEGCDEKQSPGKGGFPEAKKLCGSS